MNTPISAQPTVTLDLPDGRVTLLGTAHVSRQSVDAVRDAVDSGAYDAIAVELCPSRHGALANPESLARMDLFQVLRQGKAPMVVASLALGAYQQRLAEQFGIEPGAELKAAVDGARRHGLKLELIDREIGTTLRRCYRSVPWWQRAGLMGGLLSSVLSREQVSEAEIERLKDGDMLETTFSQFAEEQTALYGPLIDERDRYMAARLRQILASAPGRHVLAVVGAGHLKGIRQDLESTSTDDPAAVLAELDRQPPPARWPRVLPWAVVAVIVFGFAVGFARNPGLGWQLVLDWVLINGGMSALGAAIAGGHLLTIITAFVAAPLTSLNPTIGAGMVTGAMEAWLRKPNVADFSRLRVDAARLSGWWRNRVTRVLLVFILSTLGSAIGTYTAGFRIFGRLAAGA